MSVNVRYWLAKIDPHTVRVIDEEGVEHLVKRPNVKNRWSHIEREARALSAVRIVGLAEDGSILGSLAMADDDEPDDGSVEVEVSKNASDIAFLLPIILDAQDRAVNRNLEFIKMAFEENKGTVRLLADRLNSLERAWHTVITRQKEEVDALREEERVLKEERDGEGNNIADGLVQTIADGLMKGGMSKPNGASAPQTTPAPATTNEETD